jgi:anti-anti-sigma regulatory factor
MTARSEPSPAMSQPGTVVLALSGTVARGGVPELCDRLRELLRGSDAACVVCDVSALTDPGLTAVEAVARLRLTAGRLGRRFRLRGASAGLRELLFLAGLDDVLRLQAGGQAEQREQPLGVEERVQRADPPA